MTVDATPTSTLDPAVIDQLVPAPRPVPVRAAAWLVLLAFVLLVGWLWVRGIATPRIAGEVRSWGGDGPVTLGIEVRNGSAVDIELTAGYPDVEGLRPLGYTIRAEDATVDEGSTVVYDSFPRRIHPGERVLLTGYFAADDCAAVRFALPDLSVGVRIADGPFGWAERRRVIAIPGGVMDPFDSSVNTGWPGGIAQYACAPSPEPAE
ncbi:MAG: hypothetical protein R2695_19205 [Acidimicrobiales bacterium]